MSCIPRPHDAGAPNLSTTSAQGATETLLTPAGIDLPRSGAPTRSPSPFLQAGGCLSQIGAKGAGPWPSRPDSLTHPWLQRQCPHSPPASTSSASSSAPLPTSAMFLLRLPPPKNQAGILQPTPFLRSGLSPAPAREDRGGPAFLPGPGRGQSAAKGALSPPLGARRAAEHPFPGRARGCTPRHKLRPSQASPRPSTRLTPEQPTRGPASSWDPVGGAIQRRSHLVGGVTSQTQTSRVWSTVWEGA